MILLGQIRYLDSSELELPHLVFVVVDVSPGVVLTIVPSLEQDHIIDRNIVTIAACPVDGLVI